jgi:hypothetical protein
MSNNTEEVLQMLKEIETSFTYSVYIPSLQKEISFKQLTTEQLKNLYKTAINKVILNIEFNSRFNEIIKQNCLDKDINIDNLTVYDKVFIFIKTRLECLSGEVKFILTEEEKEDLNTEDNSVIVSLIEHYNNFVNKKITFEKQTYEANSCTVVCDLPTLSIENKFQQELTSATLSETNTSDKLAEIVGDTFVNEVTKYIISLKVKDTTINLKETDFKTRIDIVKALPSILIKKVLEYIENYKQRVNELLSIPIDINSQIIIKEIPLDASFYNI